MVDKQLFRLIKDRKKYLWINIINQVFGLLMNLSITFFLIFSIKFIVEEKIISMIVCISITIVSAIIRFIVFLISNHLANKLGDFASKVVRHDIYKKYLFLKNSNNVKVNEISQLSTEGIEQLKLYYAVYLPNLFFSVIAPVVLFIIMSFVDWKVALIYLVCVPIIPGSIIAVSKWAKKIFNKYWDMYLNLGNKFLDNTKGLKELRIFNDEDRIKKQMINESESFRKITMKVLVMQLVSVTIMDLTAFGGAAIGIVVSLVMMRNGLDIYMVTFLILVGAEFFIPMRTLGSAFHMAMNGATAGKKILEIMNFQNMENGNKKINNIQSIKLIDINIKIENKEILKDVNLELKKGNVYSFIGLSGCGKTTLVRNIMKLNDNFIGDIKINENNLRDIKNESLYDKACYISNNTYLFNESIRNNFKFVNPKITDKEIYKLLAIVKMKDFVVKNGGLDFIIKDDYSNLSGGQKQRIVLAIYLSKKYDLYIFDEATSNIDNDSEQIILDIITKELKSSIVIIITHRIKNIIKTNYTYLLKNKKIFESGKPKQLLAKNSETWKMYYAQKRLEEMYETKINS